MVFIELLNTNTIEMKIISVVFSPKALFIGN